MAEKTTKKDSAPNKVETPKSVFATLNAINCNEHTEKKNGLTYLSWAWAWQMVKTNYPSAFYTIYENEGGIPYFTDGKTCWVKTGVTIEGHEHIEYLPIMDNRNRSIPFENVTSMDMNKAIQRSLTKACARHGLGLYIYAGEDLPEEEIKSNSQKETTEEKPAYTPVSDKQFGAIVARFAKGVKTNNGEDYRSVWAKHTNAGVKEIRMFNKAVEEFKKLNNIV